VLANGMNSYTFQPRGLDGSAPTPKKVKYVDYSQFT